MRRAPAVAVAVALALTGSAPAVAAAKARPKPPRCLAFPDAKGDARVLAAEQTGDPALDLLKVVVSANASSLVVRYTVDALGDNPTKAWGDRFQLDFDYGGKEVEIYYKRSRTRAVEGTLIFQAGIRVDGRYVSKSDAAVTGTYQGNVMTMTTKLSGLRAALEQGVERGVLVEVEATTYGSYVTQNVVWDYARPAGRSSVFRVVPCV